MKSRPQTYSYDSSSDEESSYTPIPPPPPSHAPLRVSQAPSRNGPSSRAIVLPDDDTVVMNPRNKANSDIKEEAPTELIWATEEQSSKSSSLRFGTFCCPCLTKRQRKFVIIAVALLFAFILGLLIGSFLIDFGRNEANNVSAISGDMTTGNTANEETTNDSPTGTSSNILVGAYYYPWHSDDFHGGEYLRELLVPRHEPYLGEYDDRVPSTISQHLAWSRQANINVWVASWRGIGKREDITIRESILTNPDLRDHKISIFYETFGQIRADEEYSLHRVIPDMQHISTVYFNHPNYLKINGRPVMFVYLTRKLENIGLMNDVIDLMRQGARGAGHDDIYIVGDHAFRVAPDNIFSSGVFNPFTKLDAITNYDVYGSIGQDLYAGEEAVKAHYGRMAEWREKAQEHNCGFIPAASPGYNDQGVRPEAQHAPLSRKLTPESEFGSLFSAGLREARKLVDSNAANLLMITSFNEWHEDTQIEPTVGVTTSFPEELTYGVEYEGYGERYLNILREETLNFTTF